MFNVSELPEKCKDWKKDADKQMPKYKMGNKIINLIDKRIFEFYDSAESKLMLSDYTGVERKYIHGRCDQLGLLHESKDLKGNRVAEIIKPENLVFGKVHKITGKKKYYCNSCSCENEELFVHWKGLGPYCEDCINDDP